ncbi:MAG TPA: adenylate/guanylate cyclase domain-containing protein [Actinomycetota bacterium]
MLTCANCGRESPEDFAFCPSCSAPLAPPAPQEVRKTVTVVFCDVTGSTAMGERLDPESLRRVMSRYFAEMRAALERHGGTVEKFIGDAVMAVFGVPAIHEDDALRAVRAASEMREALEVLNKELERDHGVSLAARIGVNTGEVVAGDHGDTLVTGDAVNVAARLEQAAEPGAVLIGEETLRLVRDAVVAEPVPPLEVKGKTEPLAAFRLVQVTAGVAGVARRLDSPMVGRERELARLGQAFEAAIADRSCQLFTILGTPGVGKSRLVEEFLDSLGEATVLRGRCLPYGEGITFFPVGEVVKEAARLDDFDAPDEIERKICAVLGTDGPACSTLAQLFAAAEHDSSVEETFWAVRSFLEAVAETAPLALVFDDIHWGEPTFLDLIEHITGWAREAPILMLCVARPELLEERAGWGRGNNATTISLEPLSDDECDDLIGNLLGRAALPEEARDRILAAAEGTPLFVEEMLSMLIDDGSLARDGDRWVATGPLVDLRVPPTIQALLAARLEQLTGDERAVIQRAAVCGKQFHVGAVASLLDGGEVQPILMSLVRRDVLRPDRSSLAGQDAFRFRHQLIRDASYEAAPKALRAELHERYADWLESVGEDRVEEFEEILAYHLERAYDLLEELGPMDEAGRQLGLRAATHYAASAHRASDRSDYRAASTLHRHAADLLPEDHPDRPRTLYEVGRASVRSLDPGVALAALDAAVEAAATAGQRSIELMARIDRADIQTLIDPIGFTIDDLRAEVLAAKTELEPSGDDEALTTVWRALATVEWMPCRFDAAREAAIRAVEHARRTGDRSLLMDATMTQVAAELLGSTTPAEGRPLIDALRAEFGQEGVVGHATLVQEGCFEAMGGDFDGARRWIRGSTAVAERFGSDLWLAAGLEFGGHVELMAGDPAAAEHAYRKEYELHQRLGDDAHASTSAGYLAMALCRLGRFDEAEQIATIARAIGAEDDMATQASARCAQALVRSERGEHEAARRLAREAADMYAGAQSPWFQGDTLMVLSEVLRAAGVPEEAAEAASAALAAYERKGHEPGAASARALIDEVSAS